MIERGFIGAELPGFAVTVERSRLRLFAKAVGETDPVYLDEAAAAQAGHPDLPVPPTFLFCLEMDAPDPAALRRMLRIDLSQILHGEQGFRYHRMAHAGDRLSFSPRIADLYERKGGALQFVVRETAVRDAAGAPVADLRCVTVVRDPAAGPAA